MDFRTEGTSPRFFAQLRYRVTIERRFRPRIDSRYSYWYHMELPYVIQLTNWESTPSGRAGVAEICVWVK
jgi:hypothetical protein